MIAATNHNLLRHAFTLFLLAGFGWRCGSGQPTDQSLDLPAPNNWLTGAFTGNKRNHRFLFELNAGETIRVEVMQNGQDVGISLRGPTRGFYIDHHWSTAEPEILWATASETGLHELRILSVDGIQPHGEYRLRWQKYPAEDQGKKDLAEGFYQWRKMANADGLLPGLNASVVTIAEIPPELQISELETIAHTAVAQGAPVVAGRVLLDLARLRGSQKFSLALFDLLQAQGLFQQANAPYWHLDALKTQARLEQQMDLYEVAIGSYSNVSDAAKALRDRHQVGVAHNDRGFCQTKLGNMAAAVAEFEAALDHYSHGHNLAAQATTALNLGQALEVLGQFPRAKANFERAVALGREIGNWNYISNGYLQLGWLAYLQRDFTSAEAHYAEALTARQKTGRHPGGILDRWGSALRDQGLYEAANAKYREALALFEAENARESIHHTRTNMAELAIETGALTEARRLLAPSLSFFQKQGNRNAEAHVWRLMGRLAYREGRWPEAVTAMDTALNLLGGLQGETAEPGFARGFGNLHHGLVREFAAMLMARDRDAPGQGHAQQAFELLDNQRALVLRRSMEEPLMEPSSIPLTTYRETHERARNLAAMKGDDERMSAWTQVDLAADAVVGMARARRDHRRHGLEKYALADFQNALTPDQAALVFALDTETSWLWEVTREAMVVHELPNREALASQIGPLHTLLAHAPVPSQTSQIEGLTRQLSETLLVPLELAPTKARWLIVPDGPLNRLSFPWLLHHHSTNGQFGSPKTLTMLPSLSTGMALARREVNRKAAPMVLAAFGDAVYAWQDQANHKGDETLAGISAVVRQDFSRNLEHTREEVRAIAELVPVEKRKIFLGFAAAKANLHLESLGDFRIFHFATHGYLHPRFGDLSSLVLSRFDQAGQQVDGFLRVYEIQDWSLRAELVTLSACQTGLGETLEGEGVWGLGQAFLGAGATRVLVSLWPVRDRTTKLLMKDFYTRLLAGNQPPAQALRAAQETMAGNPQTADPHYWAGFVLLGDGLGRP